MTLSPAPRFDATEEAIAIARAAEHAIAQRSEGSEPLLHVLRSRLERERDATLRLRLARAYLRLQRSSGLSTAVEWIRGRDSMLSRAAYDVLHELREESLPALLELSTSRDPAVRWYGYEIAAHLHRTSMIPLLIRGLQDIDPGIRWAAGSGLIEVGDRALIPLLEALVSESATLTFHASVRRVLARLEVSQHEDLRTRLLESLGRHTSTVQSGLLASEWLSVLRRERALRAMSRPRQAAPVRAEAILRVVIRVAHRSDDTAVRVLWDESGLEPAGPEEWRALTESPTGTVFVAEHDGRIVGSAVATFDGWRAYIYHVTVSPAVRGRGVGHDLLTAAERHLVMEGARRIYTMVHEENTAGLAPAVACGYLPEGERVLVKEATDSG